LSHLSLCHLDEIEEPGSRAFVVGDLSLFVVRMQGQVFLYRNLCPHKGVPLEWTAHKFLDQSKTLIECANHGALFLPESGRCVSGPCMGQQLTAYPFEIHQGVITLHNP
jgi:nitrite reductase/ring-hydroxylating ferredoxin subunit